jgi:hypothetical protein
MGLGAVPGDRRRRVCVAVPELVGQRIGQRERVLHLILGADPLGVEHVLAASALGHDGEQPQLGEDRVEIPDPRIGKRVDPGRARRAPLLGPQR